ncbi:MAG: MBOAT family protein [Deltaproteobacteria bacterium]|nr:MBOAT family protein [Deltaproteobacteria bacterium]
MGFNSLDFVLFFLVVYGVYVALSRSRHAQNAMLLVASYVFYGFWDWRFCSLLLISTVVDFAIGHSLPRASTPRKKLLLTASVTTNLGILCFFKYFGFFAESTADLLALLGFNEMFTTLNIILPLGISFYTFQTMSYTIDIYRGRLSPIRNPVDFALFVSFFPQLVAGPIERASNLLPQISKPRRITASEVDVGLYLILFGYFKKLVIADNFATISETVFDVSNGTHGIGVAIGMVAFTIQIYCDFSGYTDIARGIAKLFGFDLMVNFRLPYFALNPRDFWSRWHISLSTWLRDYLYIPLGGNRHGTFTTYRNLMITMVLGGLWHGAAWPYVVWGFYHGIVLVVHRWFTTLVGGDKTEPGPLGRAWRMALMFLVTSFGFTVFRAETLTDVAILLKRLGPELTFSSRMHLLDLIFFTAPLLVVQIAQQVSGDLLIVTKANRWVRALIYGAMICGLCILCERDTQQFIYFRF